MSTVRPTFSLSSPILVMVCDTNNGDSPTEGSSISNRRGDDISARAIASICCCPPDIVPASWPCRSPSAGNVSKASARLRLMALRAALRKAPSVRFSATVSLGNSRRPSGTSATPRSTIASGDSLVRSCAVPSTVSDMRPRSGRTRPVTHFISVLLPLPLVPSSATVSPASTWSVTPRSALTAPYPASSPSMARLSAKIGLLYPLVRHDFGRRADGDDPTRVEAHHALGKAHHGLHDVLDHDDGDVLITQADEQIQHFIDFGTGEAGHGFVGNQELWPYRHRAGQLHLAQFHLAQRIGWG